MVASVASGKERPNSDIDLMIVGAVEFEMVIRLLIPCEQELRREINPHVYSVAEFNRRAHESGSFIARILKPPKVFVLGGHDELGQLGLAAAVE